MLISIVVPCYNEQEVISQTYARLCALDLNGAEKELLFVNDGSRDATLAMLRGFAADNPEVKVISFSRNFGHQPAVSAGLANASGDAIVIIDADLQDPPELIPQMIELWRQGYDVVYGKRKRRMGETVFKRFTAWGFYRFLNCMGGTYIPPDTGDFRLIDKKVAALLSSMPEQNRFLRGMTAWAGFSSTPIEFTRSERAAGETKYTLKKMLKLAGDGITSFSSRPLKLPVVIGSVLGVLALAYLIVSIVFCALGTFELYHVLFAALFGFVALLFLCMGIMGLYLGRIYDEVKGRPLYVVAEKINFDETVGGNRS